jgi:hypothetical protein
MFTEFKVCGYRGTKLEVTKIIMCVAIARCGWLFQEQDAVESRPAEKRGLLNNSCLTGLISSADKSDPRLPKLGDPLSGWTGPKHQAVDHADDGETCRNLEENSMTADPQTFEVSIIQRNQALVTR